ncbi:class I SAM-dependent methyltransferase [bacterium]|nr:class I SAM-dependent methyltransferase [bacterium]
MSAATTNLPREIKSSAHGWLIRWGIDIRRLRPDRRLLERRIFPWLLAQPECDRLLFVGCAWYTQHYPRIFAGREFWTLECDPRLARFGGPRHVVGTCARVSEHFAAASLDVVICNGVYGFGLDDAATLAATIHGFRKVLRPNGLLVFGWNNVPGNDPLGLERLDCFEGFRPLVGGPCGGGRHEVPGRSRHTFEFLTRVDGTAVGGPLRS